MRPSVNVQHRHSFHYVTQDVCDGLLFKTKQFTFLLVVAVLYQIFEENFSICIPILCVVLFAKNPFSFSFPLYNLIDFLMFRFIPFLVGHYGCKKERAPRRIVDVRP